MAKKVTRMVVYKRDLSNTLDKFAGLRTLIRDAREQNMVSILVQSPRMLGDTYEELTANLHVLAEADLALMIIPPKHRGA
ncbi:MAG: hypothetical protein QM770_24810 [Tepidisphaeraceae bacterium]